MAQLRRRDRSPPLVNIVLFALGSALAGEALYKVFSQELFPTLPRGTAQGITFGTARLILGIWSFFVLVLASAGIGPVAALLTLFLLISGATGMFFMPTSAARHWKPSNPNGIRPSETPVAFGG